MKTITAFIISLVVLITFSCSSKPNNKGLDCSDQLLTKHIISSSYDASVSLPEQWTVIDSSRYGVDKYLVDSKKIYSKDSSSSMFFIVRDIKEGIVLGNDTNEIKKYLKAEVREIKNGRDSIFDINSYSVIGWRTVTQESFVKGSDFDFLGQIMSVNNSKQIHIILRISARNFEDGMKMLDCIISSYSLGKGPCSR